jgi:hypothetical protein
MSYAISKRSLAPRILTTPSESKSPANYKLFLFQNLKVCISHAKQSRVTQGVFNKCIWQKLVLLAGINKHSTPNPWHHDKLISLSWFFHYPSSAILSLTMPKLPTRLQTLASAWQSWSGSITLRRYIGQSYLGASFQVPRTEGCRWMSDHCPEAIVLPQF